MSREDPSMALRRPIPLPDPPLQEGDLALRPWRPGDGPALAAGWADPEVARWTGVPSTTDTAAAERWIAGEADRRARGLALDLAIEVDDEVVGEIGLLNVDGEPGTAEIGWWVAPTHRGRGIAGTAAQLVASWAVDELSVTTVIARCDAENPASVRVAEAAGFCRCTAPVDRPGTEVWQFG